ncbi:hypothetical protein PQC55_gp116 [Escherichia phage vB_EcoP-CHD5UKE1]|uniref:Uncharacterized protein n=1 Tax=Escherichia phage vB_EcoP-CHD5UKE1 TaxID=2865805 RepID=A0ABX9AKF5_9CAUD|nr:hypothetical protein PQC55_gp116 [Escherichia phage vB_EcoP-CHD5UKE1]QZI80642.1 hypothetical protein CHD5UKE1_146 [Escherichia phage vB_EcoP-CHD5UKE1]
MARVATMNSDYFWRCLFGATFLLFITDMMYSYVF